MPLSWNEIKDRARAFSREWADEASEDAEAKSFWDAFFQVFGVPRRRVASFEKRIKKFDGKDGYIDLLWKGLLLIEHKSLGKDLGRAPRPATTSAASPTASCRATCWSPTSPASASMTWRATRRRWLVRPPAEAAKPCDRAIR